MSANSERHILLLLATLMLIDNYLPTYDFNEYHSIELDSSAYDIYEKMLRCNFKKSPLIRFLFSLRGISKDICTIEDLGDIGFVKLDEEPGTEILYGMLTDSPMFSTCKANSTLADFIQNTDPAIIKSVINFRLEYNSTSQLTISTETRVWCGSKAMKVKFKRYWFLIKPFSQIIRRSMLKQIKFQIR